MAKNTFFTYIKLYDNCCDYDTYALQKIAQNMKKRCLDIDIFANFLFWIFNFLLTTAINNQMFLFQLILFESRISVNELIHTE